MVGIIFDIIFPLVLLAILVIILISGQSNKRSTQEVMSCDDFIKDWLEALHAFNL